MNHSREVRFFEMVNLSSRRGYRQRYRIELRFICAMEHDTVTESLGADRRAWLAGVGAAMMSSWDARIGLGDDDSVPVIATATSDIDAAVSRGIDFLIKAQRPNGAIADRGFDIAISSLVIIAMAAAGSRPNQAQRGLAMQMAIDFVLSDGHQDEQGYFGKADGSRMYGHGITTWMLSEILKSKTESQQEKILRDALIPATDLILAAQEIAKAENEMGGWHYTPDQQTSDLSVSVWQLIALRSAKDNGVDITGQVFEKALVYLRSLFTFVDQAGDAQGNESGMFRYRLGIAPTFSMTAAGLSAMQLCGSSDGPMAKAASNWLLKYHPEKNERFLYYGLFHYAHGMHNAGGPFSQRAAKIVPDLLLDLQRDDGAWLPTGSEERNYGTVYCTALTILGLTAGTEKPE